MCYKGEILNFEYERQEDGTFLYKAKESSISSKSKKGKAQYKEKPEYPLLEQIEQKSIERYQQDLKDLAKQIVVFIKPLNND